MQLRCLLGTATVEGVGVAPVRWRVSHNDLRALGLWTPMLSSICHG